MTPKPQAMNAKVDKWDYFKLKIFYTAKEASNKIKRQPSEWEKIIADHMADWGQYPKYIKNPYNLIAKNPSFWFKKWVEDLNRHPSKEKQTANKYMKRCSTSLIIREMQIKTTIRYLLTPVRTAIIKKTRNSKCQQGHKGKGILCALLVWIQTGAAAMENNMEVPQKIISRTTIWPRNFNSGYLSEGNETLP